MPQSNLFKQHDHTTVMSLLIFLVLSQSHHKKITYFKYIVYTHNFLKFFLSSDVFSLLHDKSFETN